MLLDQCNSGPTFLKDPRIAELVANELHRFDDDLYDLIAYTIMPNHVHILINTAIQISTATNIAEWETLNIKPLDQIMKRIKGPSAVYANRLLKRSGAFWQKESFDHYIRNEKEFQNIVNYILSNPMKAKIVSDWINHPFTFLQCNRPF